MTTSPFAGLEDKQAARNRRDLPGGGELAEMIRGGETVASLRERFGTGQQTIYVRLRDSGYLASGESAHKQPPRITVPERAVMPIADDDAPACHDADPLLFESTFLEDHRRAKAICRTCPARMFAACGRLADDQERHDGTWAGVLYVDGHQAPNGKGKPGRPRKAGAA